MNVWIASWWMIIKGNTFHCSPSRGNTYKKSQPTIDSGLSLWIYKKLSIMDIAQDNNKNGLCSSKMEISTKEHFTITSEIIN